MKIFVLVLLQFAGSAEGHSANVDNADVHVFTLQSSGSKTFYVSMGVRLRLACAPCRNASVKWSTPGSGGPTNLTLGRRGKEQDLQWEVNTTSQAVGNYSCSCQSGTASYSAEAVLQICDDLSKPKLIHSGDFQRLSCDSYRLTERRVKLSSEASPAASSAVCFDVESNSTGGSAPRYTWSRRGANTADLEMFNSGKCGSVKSSLCVLPGLESVSTRSNHWKKRRWEQHYMAEVANDEGRIVVHTSVQFTVPSACEETRLTPSPHSSQTTGEQTVGEDGSAVAYCIAKYTDRRGYEVEYSLCKDLESEERDISSCYEMKTCIKCGDKNFHADITSNYITLPDDESSGTVRACMFNITHINTGSEAVSKYSCISRMKRSKSNPEKYLGPPASTSSFDFHVMSPQPIDSYPPKPGQMKWEVVLGAVLGVVVFAAVLLAVVIAVSVMIRRKSNGSAKHCLSSAGRSPTATATAPAPRALLTSTVETNLYSIQTSPGTIRREVSNSISFPLISAHETFRQRSLSYAKCADLRKRLNACKELFLPGIKIYPRLLATMKEKGLLGPGDFDDMTLRFDQGKMTPEIATYFYDRILLNWAPKVFQSLLRDFVKLLEEDEDPSNRGCAESFKTDIFKMELSQSFGDKSDISGIYYDAQTTPARSRAHTTQSRCSVKTTQYHLAQEDC